MTNELESIPRSSAGWPFLADNAPVHDVPAFTQQLAAALAGFTPGAGTPPVDSGWIPLTLETGWSADNGYYRCIGQLIVFRGELYGGTSGTQPFILPTGYRPTHRSVYLLPRSGATTAAASITVNTVGTTSVVGTVPTATPGLNLAGISYFK